tara:strand:- start:944 stop:1249 length:306 start_codon:yes stop_codon:yes gene_type:complete
MKKIKNLTLKELNELAEVYLETLDVQKKLLKYWESTNIRYDSRGDHQKMCAYIRDRREEIRETINMLENILCEIQENHSKFICSIEESTKTVDAPSLKIQS